MTVHIVQKGDTLWKIAKQHQIPFDEIKRLNAHLANPDYIVPGMEIFLPDTVNMPTRKKEAPIAPQAMPAPQQTPKKEMPVKETPRTPVPTMPPQLAPAQPQPQPPSWMPFPQPIPMPMPYPQQMPPIVMPQQPAVPQTIRIEQPPMPAPTPIQILQPPQTQSMPMQCPSCRMTVMIAMPHMPHKEEVKEEKVEQAPVKQLKPSSCSPTMIPRMEEGPWMQPAMPMPWGSGHCRSCHQPVPFHPAWHWPAQAMPNWSQAMSMPMNDSTSALMPQGAGTEQWQHPHLKCEMQQHIINQYYDEIREIEQSNRPCHPPMMPLQPMPYMP